MADGFALVLHKDASKRFQSEIQVFVEEMVAKFVKRAAKHPEDNILAADVNVDNWDQKFIEDHLLAEVEEYLTQHGEGDSGERRKELIDIANMAFVLWFKARNSKPTPEAVGKEGL